MRIPGAIMASVGWMAGVVAGPPAAREFQITDADRAHWAFQPVKRPEIPEGGAKAVDFLVMEQLAEARLVMNPPATKRELIRRATYDLTGLPPTPEEVAAFVTDESADGYERLIDRLLARPQYGERWGRHWLDVARFAQSNGYERDGEKPLAWRYRDYVIKAFNEDRPYDRFVMEQIAGDELPDATADSVAATGFQRLGVFDDEPDDRLTAEFDALDDVMGAASAAFLGLTIGCARCHDHKSDPISQSDYYSLLAFFRGIKPFASGGPSTDSPGFAPFASPQDVRTWVAERDRKLNELERARAGAGDGPGKEPVESEIKQLTDHVPFEWTLAVREHGPTPPVTHVLVRGNAATEGATVEPAFPAILAAARPVIPAPAADAPSSGRRLVLAQWIADPRHPLTARVMVNRVWKHHFGRGLVRTTTDFGRAGSPPTHPRLLDWLADEFVRSGWSVKALHKSIMLSDVYRQSSAATNEAARAVDPGNDLLWRQNLRRLEAEAVRDSVLSIAGTLNLKMGGRGFFPHLNGEVLAGQSRPGLDWEVSNASERARRSVYAYVRRTMAIPLLDNFDYNNTTSPLPERATTTVAPQALMLLNDDFMHQQAAAFAERVVAEAGPNPAAQVRRAFQLAVNRDPTAREMEMARAFLQRQTAAFTALAARLLFRPDVSTALATDYFARLEPADFLTGPRCGWTYLRGFWAPAYEGIRIVDRQRAPLALWQGADFGDGVIEARLHLAGSTESAGLFFRATAEGDTVRGYEVAFDPRGQRVILRCHGTDVTSIAEAEAELPVGRPLAVRIEAAGPHLRVFLDGSPRLDVIHDRPVTGPGRIGVGTWGGALVVDEWVCSGPAGEGVRPVRIPSDAAGPERRALESFCLLVFNLNEVLYVD